MIEERNKDGNKDTSCLLASGAQKVYWLKTLKTHSLEGFETFMSTIPQDTLIICESNSLRKVVRPGIFIMMNNSPDNTIKETASEVIDRADIIIDYDFRNNINMIIDKLKIDKVQMGLQVKNICS